MEKKLNVDIGRSVSSFEAYVKDFELKLKFYKTLFRGKGLDFDGYRTYSQDDDARTIDWKASKRSNELLIKQYIEEMNLQVVFAIDVGDSMITGSANKLKCEYVAEVVAALAHLILTSGDKIGFILYSDEVKKYIAPAKGMKQFYVLMDFLLDLNSYGGRSNFKKAEEFIANYLGNVSAVILLSDFINFDDSKLKFISNRFETMGIMIKDPIDRTLPDISAEIVFEDPSSGQQLLVNPKIAKKVYDSVSLEQENRVKKSFKDAGIDLLSLTTSSSFNYELAQFLKERVRERRT